MKITVRSDSAFLTLILAIAFVARIGFAYDQIRKIPKEALAEAPFAQETGNIALSLATGKGFSNPFRRETGPTAWLAPVYPLLVAGAFKVFGIFSVSSFLVLVGLNILFSTAVCWPVFAIGKQVAGRNVGAVGALLWALSPGAIMVPFEWIWDTSLSALLATALLLATLRVADSDRVRDWSGYGLLWGFTLMTNPSVGSLLPFLVGWAAWQQKVLGPTTPERVKGREWLRNSGLALGLAILCCIPWTVRNYVVFHRLVPLRSNFPLELYIGNNENYDSQRTRYPGPITKERETVRYFHLGEVAFMNEEMRKATNFILTHPREELILFGERFAAFWTGLPNALQNFIETDSWLVRALMLCAVFSGIGALGGLVLILKHRSVYTFPLGSYPAVFPFLYYITHTSLRYRHPIDPVLLLLTAVALVEVWKYSQTFVRARGSN